MARTQTNRLNRKTPVRLGVNRLEDRVTPSNTFTGLGEAASYGVLTFNNGELNLNRATVVLWAPSLNVSGPFSAPHLSATINASELTLGEENGIDRAELTLQIAIGPVLLVSKSQGGQQIEHAYTRAQQLALDPQP